MKSLLKVLAIVLILAVTLATVHAQETITYGDTIEGTLVAGERGTYTFEAAAGDMVLISLRSEDFDPIVYLLDSSGSELARNDDSGGELNSLIAGFIIPADGVYTIQAASFSDAATGSYTLSLDTSTPNIVEYGETVDVDVESPSNLFAFSATQGDVIAVNLLTTAQYSDMSLEMTVPAGYIEYGNYVSDRVRRIGPYTVPETGTYLLNVRSQEPARVMLTRINPIVVSIGDTVTATFDEGVGQLFFSVQVNVPTVVDIVVDSDNVLDTKLELISPFGYSENQNDDAEGTVDPALLEELLNEVGTYYLVLDASNPNASLRGDVTLSITEAELPSLEEGPVDLKFDYDNNERVFVFDVAEAGETVRLTVEIQAIDTWTSPTLELSQKGTVFASFNSNGLKRYIYDVTIPETGTVNLVIRAYENVNIRVTLGRSVE